VGAGGLRVNCGGKICSFVRFACCASLKNKNRGSIRPRVLLIGMRPETIYMINLSVRMD
jgi:hypothetical protein